MKTFIWLDDSPSSISASLRAAIRESGYDAGEQTDLKIVEVDGKDVGAALTKLLAEPVPDFVILDHFLNKAAGTVFRKGSTVAAEIRDHWPNVSIVGVTGGINTSGDRLGKHNSAMSLGSSFRNPPGYKRTRRLICRLTEVVSQATQLEIEQLVWRWEIIFDHFFSLCLTNTRRG